MAGCPPWSNPSFAVGTFAARTQPELIADDLVLRPWVSGDAATIVTAYDDPAIQQWHARTMTRVEATEWIESRTARWSAEIGADWAVTTANGLVGRVGLRTLDLSQAQGEAAYWVAPGGPRQEELRPWR